MSNWYSFTPSIHHLERKHLEGEKALDPISNHNYLKVITHYSNFHVPAAIPLIKSEYTFCVIQRVLRLTKSMYVSPFLGHQSFGAAEFMFQYSYFTKKLYYSGSTGRMRKVMIHEK